MYNYEIVEDGEFLKISL